MRRLAWGLLVVTVLVNLGTGVFLLWLDGPSVLVEALLVVGVLVLPAVGALVASRHPENSIGWLFLGAGLLLAVSGASTEYSSWAFEARPVRPGGLVSAWLASWLFLPALFGVPTLLFLLFPDGRPLTPRWRWVVGLAVVGQLCQAAAAAFRPGPMQDTVAGVPNPYPVSAGAARALELVGWTTSLATIAAAGLCLLLRGRRSSGEERLQMRWFLYAAALFVAACLASAVLFLTPLAAVGQGLVFGTFTVIPVAAGVAILRHRLYDIDVVINRTLVYGTLTLALLATYLLMVLLTRLVLSPLTGESDLAVATSTLAVAALFGPLRRRIQDGVDRRYYRQRYDAQLAIEDFSVGLRQEVDLESVCADLRSAVNETMSPAHVSLWLRSSR